MSELEDLLYRAHAEGLKDKVFKEVGKLKELPKYEYAELYDIYTQAYTNVKRKNTSQSQDPYKEA